MRPLSKFFVSIAQISLAILVFATPIASYAASNPFTTPIFPAACNCLGQTVVGGTGTVASAPDYGCVLQVIQNVINLAVYLGVLITIVYIVVAGAQMVINSTNPNAIKAARGRIWNGVIGIALILCSWLIVDFVMKTLYNSTTYGPWNSILAGKGNDLCLKPTEPTGIPTTISGAISQFANPGTGSSVAGGTAASNGSGNACDPAAVQQAANAGGVSMSASQASTLACIAGPESNCGALMKNYNWNGVKSMPPSTAWGPFQITLKGNATCLNNTACQQAAGVTGSLDCRAAFTSSGIAIPGQLLSQCQTAAANLGCSAAAASCIVAANKGSYSAWTGNADSTAAHQQCVAKNSI
jgi:hypothetical protein